MCKVDYPAAHSMDTRWFAVDENGEVALFHTHETGVVPEDAMCTDEVYGDVYEFEVIGYVSDIEPCWLNDKMMPTPTHEVNHLSHLIAVSAPIWYYKPPRYCKKHTPDHPINIKDFSTSAYKIPNVRFAEIEGLDVAQRFKCHGWSYKNEPSGTEVISSNLSLIPSEINTGPHAVPFDVYKVRADWHDAASAGKYLAQYALAEYYKRNKCYQQAQHWDTLAKAQGVPEGEEEYILSCSTYDDWYSENEPTAADIDKALERVKRELVFLYEGGYPNIARWTDSYETVQRSYQIYADFQINFALWHDAAFEGDILAQYTLGYFFMRLKNYREAMHWYYSVAAQTELTPKNPDDIYENGSAAQCEIGYLYEYGYGVEQDYQQALFWYQKSAEKNHCALGRLGMMYLYGRGVPQSDERALELLELAYAKNYYPVRALVGELREKLAK